jgi:quercetin dioxygenase-like cupin family protein
MPGTVEHVIVSSGRMLAGLREDPVELGPGDYVLYPGDVPHTAQALEQGTTALLVSEHV